MSWKNERINHIFQFMEYDELSEMQMELVVSYEQQFKRWNRLTDKQYEVLEDIFKQAAERA